MAQTITTGYAALVEAARAQITEVEAAEAVEMAKREDVVLVEEHRISLVNFMEPGFVQSVVHDAVKKIPVPLLDLHPKLFPPSP